MTTLIERLTIAIVIALICAGATLVVADAQAPAAPVAQTSTTPACVTCHSDFQTTWQAGSHGQAMIDKVFTDAWDAQGKPSACLACHTTGYDATTGKYMAEGVTCEACHSPVPTNHPSENMPVDKSTDMCGRCHSNTQFAGVPNWEMSTHYQRNITCSVCHDPHSTSLKMVAGRTETEDPSSLCMNCHKDYATDFTHSSHGAAGVTCVSCHLTRAEQPAGFETAHKIPDHNFMPELATCTSCHARQMHTEGESAATDLTVPSAEVAVEPAAETEDKLNNLEIVSEEPVAVSPIGFAGVAGLLGLAGGMVLAPWLERAYQRMNKRGDK